MKRFIYAILFVAGISFSAANVTIAQETKAKAACCNKAQTASADMKKGDCPMAAKKDCPIAAKSKGECPKNCPMANKKDCTKANCPMKSGAVAGKKSSKSGPVAMK
jgi:hypothetical protein